MKIPKLIGFDEEIYKKLQKEDNAAALVNKLVAQHYQNFQSGMRNPLEIRQIQLKNYSRNAKKIRKEAKILQKIYKMADSQTIRWLIANIDNLGADNYLLHNYLLKKNIKLTYAQEDNLVEEVRNNVQLLQN